MGTKQLERIFRIIQLLSADTSLNAEELARECNVSVRTIYRDLSSISDFIPLIYEDGYKFLFPQSLPPINLTPEEIFALHLASTGPATGPKSPFHGAVRSALSKISDFTNMEIEDKEIAKVDYVMTIDKPITDYSLNPRKFGEIERSISERRILHIKYFSLRTGMETERNVDPYALVFRRHAWYLIGYCHLRENIRTFRVERIKDAYNIDEPFERPDDFDIATYLEDAWELYKGGETIDAKILFDKSIAPLLLEGRRHHNQKIEVKVDGSLIYTVRVRGVEEIGRWILSFGRKAEVLSPPALRSYVARELRSAVSKYGPED